MRFQEIISLLLEEKRKKPIPKSNIGLKKLGSQTASFLKDIESAFKYGARSPGEAWGSAAIDASTLSHNKSSTSKYGGYALPSSSEFDDVLDDFRRDVTGKWVDRETNKPVDKKTAKLLDRAERMAQASASTKTKGAWPGATAKSTTATTKPASAALSPSASPATPATPTAPRAATPSVPAAPKPAAPRATTTPTAPSSAPDVETIKTSIQSLSKDQRDALRKLVADKVGAA